MTELEKLEILGLGLAKVVLKSIAKYLSMCLYLLVGMKSGASFCRYLCVCALPNRAGELSGGLKYKTQSSLAGVP